MKNEKKKKLMKISYLLLLIVCIGTFTYSLINIIKWNKDNIQNNKEEKIIKETVVVEEVINSNNTEIVNEPTDPNANNPYYSYIKMNMINVDFSELKKINSDTKGWLQVGGTNVNYPFVQGRDNSYYLTRSFEKKWTDAGWIFLDYRNDINNLSRNNIIYGHARLNGTMFGTLKNMLKNDWFKNKDNHIIKLSTEKENTLWQIFSVYNIVTESYYITTDFKSDEDFQKFIDTMISRSKWNFNADVNINDKILTLSTCYKTDQKIVVQAKLIKREAR